MTERLLPYYEDELRFVRRRAREFGVAHPRVAGRLGLRDGVSSDPHVERIIEAFALLTARTRYRLDDELPELTDAMLAVLYPHAVTPTPARGIVELTPDLKKRDAVATAVVPKGAEIETALEGGGRAFLTTTRDVTVDTLSVAEASLTPRPFVAPANPAARDTAAVLEIALATPTARMTFADWKAGKFVFHLAETDSFNPYALFELLSNHTLEIGVAGGPEAEQAVFLPAENLRPVGLGDADVTLPAGPRTHPAYVRLTELFAFPERFLFLEVTGLTRRVLDGLGERLSLFLYLDRVSPDLDGKVTADIVRPHCVPAVNLYRRTADPPVTLDERKAKHRVVPDRRAGRRVACHSIESVRLIAPSGAEERTARPLYDVTHDGDDAAPRWLVHRDPDAPDSGELEVSIVDPDGTPLRLADWIADVDVLCFNPELGPQTVRVDADALRLRDAPGGVGPVPKLVGSLRARVGSAQRRGRAWDFVSQLSLNHLSLADGGSGEADRPIRKLLELHDVVRSETTRRMVTSVSGLTVSPSVARIGGAGGGFVRGLRVAARIDGSGLRDGEAFLLATVLESFLEAQCHLNTFVRFEADVEDRDGQTKSYRRWPPRSGRRVLT